MSVLQTPTFERMQILFLLDLETLNPSDFLRIIDVSSSLDMDGTFPSSLSPHLEPHFFIVNLATCILPYSGFSWFDKCKIFFFDAFLLYILLLWCNTTPPEYAYWKLHTHKWKKLYNVSKCFVHVKRMSEEEIRV